MRIALVFLTTLTLLLTSCFFGSTLNFDEEDAQGLPNLVPNGDLEEGLYGVYKRENLPEHWMILQNPRDPEATAWEADRGLGDSRCLRLMAGSTRLTLISDSFEIYPTAAYYNHIWVKTDIDTGEEIECRFIAFDENSETVNQFTVNIVPKTTWKKVEFNAAFFKKTARFGRLMVVLPPQSGRRVWVDGIGSYNVVSDREE